MVNKSVSKNIRKNDGKEAEKFAKDLFLKSGFHFERLKDAGGLGGNRSANTADAVVGKNMLLMYLEVKSTIKDRFLKSNFNKDQLKLNLVACRKGIAGLYLIMTDDGLTLSIYEWSQILLFFADKKAKGRIDKHVRPIHVAALAGRYISGVKNTGYEYHGKFWGDRLRQTAVEIHKSNRRMILDTEFDFGDKKKYGRLKP